MTLVLLIPAFEPEQRLLPLLESLSQASCFAAIVLVNDGSSAACDWIFEAASHISAVHVRKHSANAGKGAALKTGFAFAMQHTPSLAGIVTADADGQHLPSDILHVAERLRDSENALVLGVRSFQGRVPLRNRFGNWMSRAAVRLLFGETILDTQTGLRGIPATLLAPLLEQRTNRYDYELEMLVAARRRGYRLEQTPIQTVYETGNRTSHFRPVADTMKVALVLTKSFVDLSPIGRMRAAWFTLAFCGALSLYGFATQRIFSQTIWSHAGWVHAAEFVAVFLFFSVPVLAWTSKYFLGLAVTAVLIATGFAVGPAAPLAVLLLLFSAAAMGRVILRIPDPSEGDLLIALLVGIGILINLAALLVRLPWNYPWVYAILLILPIALAPALALETLKSAGRLIRPVAFDSFSQRAAAAALTMVLIAHWLVVLKPEVSEDGLAMHLAIASGVAEQHRFAFDLPHHIWAAMPMGGDWCFTLAYIMGGEFAARLLNFAFLLVLVALLYLACRRFLGRAAALWVATLFAVTPLVQLVTGSLFIENVLAVFVFGALGALWRWEETGRVPYLYAAALLFGTALHIKLGSLAFVIPGLVLLGLQMRRKWKALAPHPVRRCALGVLIVIAAGAPPYAIALTLTGDPLFPYLNRVFHSRLLPAGLDVGEPRFHERLKLGTLYDLMFHSSRFYEGQDGSLGLQYLLLVPAGVLLTRRANYAVWSATLVALAGSLGILVTQPNLRYLYPALPLLQLPIAVLLAGFKQQPLLARALVAGGFAAALGINLCLLPSSNWYHKSFFATPLLAAEGRELYLEEMAPRRILIDDLNRKHPGEAVFIPDDSPIAGIEAPAFRDHWHDPATKAQVDSLHDANEFLELMRRWNVRRFLLPARAAALRSPVVREFAAICVEPDLRAGAYFLGRLNEPCTEIEARRARAVPWKGRIDDDLSPAVKLTGNWTRGEKFILASAETVSYSKQPGATVRFAFEGNAVKYLYTGASNRGIAQITIDGIAKRDLDLYSAGNQWQSALAFNDLKDGHHEIEITVTGRKRAESADCYVDVDAFVVPGPSANRAP